MVKLVISDLDGTLLLNGSQELPEGVCDLILRLKEKGILFVAASGRQYANLRRLFEPVKDEIGYICENGCLVFYKGKRLYKAQMDWQTGQKILEEIMKTADVEALLSGENTSYIQPKKDSYRYHLEHVVKNNVTVVEDIRATEEPYFKISVYEETGILKQADRWKKKFGEKVTVVTSGNEWLDMMPYEVNKGKALKILLEFLGIEAKDCMAFGDNYNDIEMLQMAGISYAMDTAQPEVKELCSCYTDRVEHVLEQLLI